VDVDCTKTQVCKRMGLIPMPQMKLYKNGLFEVDHTDARTAEDMKNWIDEKLK
jgi:hypothetical protein